MTAPPRMPSSTKPAGGSSTQREFAGRRAVAVLFSTYPSDPRPRRAAEALVKEGFNVEVICLKRGPGRAGERFIQWREDHTHSA